jgi:hypothetical protein
MRYPAPGGIPPLAHRRNCSKPKETLLFSAISCHARRLFDRDIFATPVPAAGARLNPY